MQKNILKYYKRTLKSFFISKYNYLNFFKIIDCKHLFCLALKISKLKISNLVCGFFFFFFFFGFLNMVFKKAKKKKNIQFKFLGCFQLFATNLKYFLLFRIFRKITIFSFLGSYNLKKKGNGFDNFKFVITNLSYILKKPGLKWEHFMFFDIFFTNNLKLIYLVTFSKSLMLKQQLDFLFLFTI